jgi:hypothetical protein
MFAIELDRRAKQAALPLASIAGKTGCIATSAAQQASAMCSSAADTPAAASRRRIVTRRRTARRGPAGSTQASSG